MKRKRRLSASVDADLLEAAEAAAARGLVPNVSSWVNLALRLKVEHDRRLLALRSFIADYEREHGSISPEEMERAARHARSRSLPVRKLRGERARSRSPRRKTG